MPRVSPPRIAITLGDPAGIGPEIIAKTLSTWHGPSQPLVIGPVAALAQAMARLGIYRELVHTSLESSHSRKPDSNTITVIDTGTGAPPPPTGIASAAGGAQALAALKLARKLARQGMVDALVTAPLCKEAVRLAGSRDFIGHTEFLATADRPVRMMMTCPRLTVVLATTHHPLADLPGLMDGDGIFDTIRLTHDALLRAGGRSNPRIAVCGLNPHPGEFGPEESEIIAPAVERAREAGINADGPHAADGLFGRVGAHGTHDAVVAMYHDQGLIPVKRLGRMETVNVTLGLPFVRTSPGHGTAFDIAGRGVADPRGMEAALAAALHWVGAPRAREAAG